MRALACGLAAQGFERGMRLAIIGDNRPRLYWSMAAAQALGGIAGADVPGRAGGRIRLRAERRGNRLRDRRGPGAGRQGARGDAARSPTLQHIYYDDPRGLRNYEGVTSFERLQEIGREFDRAHPGFYEREIAKGRADDVSVMLYTSGTTGKPKGVCQTHRAFIEAAARRLRVRPPRRRRQRSCRTCRWRGSATICFRTRSAMVRRVHDQLSRIRRHGDDRSARDRADRSTSRRRAIFENLLTQVMIRMEDASRAQALAVPHVHGASRRRCGAEILDGKPGVCAR